MPKSKLTPTKIKLHYAPTKKRALCGRPNPAIARTRGAVTCANCKRWMRYLTGSSNFRRTRKHKITLNTRGPASRNSVRGR